MAKFTDHKTIGKKRKKMESNWENGSQLQSARARTARRSKNKATKVVTTNAFTDAGTNIADGISAAINGFAQ